MDFVEQLKSSVDIVKVVGEYVRLRKAGAGPRYTGLCPFHTEKTPSFSVHHTHQFYKCFGCGAGGDVIKFVMEIERLSFFEALKLLADRNGIQMPKRAEYSEDIDILHLSSELVVDAVIEPDDLRDELIRRYAHAESKDRGFSERHNPITPA